MCLHWYELCVLIYKRILLRLSNNEMGLTEDICIILKDMIVHSHYLNRVVHLLRRQTLVFTTEPGRVTKR